MKQSEHLNPSEETGTGCHVTSMEGHAQTSMEVYVDNSTVVQNEKGHRLYVAYLILSHNMRKVKEKFPFLTY